MNNFDKLPQHNIENNDYERKIKEKENELNRIGFGIDRDKLLQEIQLLKDGMAAEDVSELEIQNPDLDIIEQINLNAEESIEVKKVLTYDEKIALLQESVEVIVDEMQKRQVVIGFVSAGDIANSTEFNRIRKLSEEITKEKLTKTGKYLKMSLGAAVAVVASFYLNNTVFNEDPYVGSSLEIGSTIVAMGSTIKYLRGKLYEKVASNAVLLRVLGYMAVEKRANLGLDLPKILEIVGDELNSKVDQIWKYGSNPEGSDTRFVPKHHNPDSFEKSFSLDDKKYRTSLARLRKLMKYSGYGPVPTKFKN
jgi:hypothetical protein